MFYKGIRTWGCPVCILYTVKNKQYYILFDENLSLFIHYEKKCTFWNTLKYITYRQINLHLPHSALMMV